MLSTPHYAPPGYELVERDEQLCRGNVFYTPGHSSGHNNIDAKARHPPCHRPGTAPAPPNHQPAAAAAPSPPYPTTTHHRPPPCHRLDTAHCHHPSPIAPRPPPRTLVRLTRATRAPSWQNVKPNFLLYRRKAEVAPPRACLCHHKRGQLCVSRDLTLTLTLTPNPNPNPNPKSNP